ncbi:MAG: ABC transporter permease subunit [Dactylosporangium sp.]|nr:ABC transporter permease [Dactylosporangium sp.]NNJ62932.1 ABC transporter permease subunit [Dactylosporangium sp.]
MNPTIARITARGLVGRRRFLLLLPLPLVLLVLATLMRSFDSALEPAVTTVLIAFGIAVVVPFTALVIGTGVLGPEIDDGTLLHILAKPLPRREIILTKFAVACGLCLPVCVVSLFAAGWIIDSVRLGAGFAVGAAVAAMAYCTLFGALSLLIRRPVLLGLAYILVWEGLLGNLVTGTGVLSIQQYAVTIAGWVSGSGVVDGRVSLPVSLIMAGVFTIGATLLAIDRLRSFSIAGSTG